MASEIRVNTINNRSGLGTVSITDTGLVVSGIITATSIDTSSTSTFSSGLNVTGGSVGIGTDNPDRLLHLGSTGAPVIKISDYDTGVPAPSYAEMSFNGGNMVFSADAGNVSGATRVAFEIDGDEKVRITSAGNVGIGTDIPGSYDSGGRTLVISENSTLAGMTIRSSTQGAVYFADGLTGNEAYRGRIEYSHSTDALNFGTAGTGSKLSITSGGNVQIANGNLVFSTSGTGIDFSAASGSASGSASALLDDYEEGTFTPIDSSGAGLTLTEARGHYVKVGNVVHCQVRLVWPSQANSNNAVIGGFPFNANNPTDVSNGAVPSGFGYISSGSVIPQIHKSGGDDTTTFYNFSVAMTNANFSGIQVRFGVTYRTS